MKRRSSEQLSSSSLTRPRLVAALTLALGLALAALPSPGCASYSGADGVGRCSTPAEGCACVDGEQMPCGETLSYTKGADSAQCKLGTRTCFDGVWGSCQLNGKQAIQSVAQKKLQGPASPCVNNPCDPTCTNFNDDETDVPTGPGTGLVVADGGGIMLDPDGGTQGGGVCTNLQCNIAPCMNMGGYTATKLKGIVYDPAGKNPIPNVAVWIPNTLTPVPLPTDGLFCDSCAPPADPIASAITNYKGEFTLNNVPSGINVPVVIKSGKWQRQFSIPFPANQACTTKDISNDLGADGRKLIRFPKNRTEGSIPRIAFMSGSADAFECVLYKMGLDTDANYEFSGPTDASGNLRPQRIHWYQSDKSAGENLLATSGGPGASVNTLTPSAARLANYDAVILSCEGNDYARTATEYTNLVNYVNSGGRVFATHYSYMWLMNASAASKWPQVVNAWTPENASGNSVTAFVDRSFTKGDNFALWLDHVNASPAPGILPVLEWRRDYTTVNQTNATRWLTAATGGNGLPAGAGKPCGADADCTTGLKCYGTGMCQDGVTACAANSNNCGNRTEVCASTGDCDGTFEACNTFTTKVCAVLDPANSNVAPTGNGNYCTDYTACPDPGLSCNESNGWCLDNTKCSAAGACDPKTTRLCNVNGDCNGTNGYCVAGDKVCARPMPAAVPGVNASCTTGVQGGQGTCGAGLVCTGGTGKCADQSGCNDNGDCGTRTEMCDANSDCTTGGSASATCVNQPATNVCAVRLPAAITGTGTACTTAVQGGQGTCADVGLACTGGAGKCADGSSCNDNGDCGTRTTMCTAAANCTGLGGSCTAVGGNVCAVRVPTPPAGNGAQCTTDASTASTTTSFCANTGLVCQGSGVCQDGSACDGGATNDCLTGGSPRTIVTTSGGVCPGANGVNRTRSTDSKRVCVFASGGVSYVNVCSGNKCADGSSCTKNSDCGQRTIDCTSNTAVCGTVAPGFTCALATATVVGNTGNLAGQGAPLASGTSYPRYCATSQTGANLVGLCNGTTCAQKTCTLDANCAAGQLCIGGLCSVPDYKVQRCDGGKCADGSNCAVDNDCGDRTQSCSGTGLCAGAGPNTYCTPLASSAIDDGTTTFTNVCTTGGSLGICNGQTCQPKACTLDSQCSTAQFCNAGFCATRDFKVARCDGGKCADGTACSLDSQCGDRTQSCSGTGLCAGAGPNTYCTPSTTSAIDNGTTTYTNICVIGGNTSTCGSLTCQPRACVTSADCGSASLYCNAGVCAAIATSYQVAKCTGGKCPDNSNCAADADCGLRSDTCTTDAECLGTDAKCVLATTVRDLATASGFYDGTCKFRTPAATYVYGACDDGVCQPKACASDSDCPANQVCNGGTCRVPKYEVDQCISGKCMDGSACAADADCQKRTQTCSTDANCSAIPGAKCVASNTQLSDGTKLCALNDSGTYYIGKCDGPTCGPTTCTTNADCTAGYACTGGQCLANLNLEPLMTFNVPIGSASPCGRVVYADFHVSAGAQSGLSGFPQSCNPGDLSGQEKALEYMIFDLTSCISPDYVPVPPAPTYFPATTTRDYFAECPSGHRPVWHFFDWMTHTPSDTNIKFAVQTGDSVAALSPAVPILFATVAGPPITVWTGVDLAPIFPANNIYPGTMLRVTITLNPSTDKHQTPVLDAWRQSYSCVPTE